MSSVGGVVASTLSASSSVVSLFSCGALLSEWYITHNVAIVSCRRSSVAAAALIDYPATLFGVTVAAAAVAAVLVVRSFSSSVAAAMRVVCVECVWDVTHGLFIHAMRAQMPF